MGNQALPGKFPVTRAGRVGAQRTAGNSPWQFARGEDGESVDIVGQAILLTNIQDGTSATIAGLTGLALGVDTTYWLSGTFADGVPTAWSVTTTAPSGDRITWGGSPNFHQTGAWYPLGRVVAGSPSGLPGLSFNIEDDSYFLEQLCTVRLAVANICTPGGPAYYPRPL